MTLEGCLREEKLKIVLVDDEVKILEVIRQYIQANRDYIVFTARDGLEALDIIEREDIDCCLSDLSMPNLDGVELTRRIHLYDNTIPVVVMTGYPSMEKAIHTLQNGVADFLTKPVRMEHLLGTLERVLRERSAFIDRILFKEEARKKKRLHRINKELEEKISEVETIHFILRKLNQKTNSRDIFHALAAISGEITTCEEAHFCVIDQNRKDYQRISSFRRDNGGTEQGISAPEKFVIKRVLHEKMPFIVKRGGLDGQIMAVPFKIRSEVFGILVLAKGGERHHFTEEELFYINILSEKASSLIENLALYENINEHLFSTFFAFVETIEARDPYTKQHSTRVTKYATAIARAMNCSQEDIDKIKFSANLHDIGKIGIPDRILLKEKDLTQEEFEFIKRHPVIGSSIVGNLCMLTDEQEIIRHHHERWDGNGYPDCLQGNEIPFISRILSVADVYDALTSDRSYRKRLPDETALRFIKDNEGGQFDPQVVNVLMSAHRQGELSSAPI